MSGKKKGKKEEIIKYLNVNVYLSAEVLIHRFVYLVVCVGVTKAILWSGGG